MELLGKPRRYPPSFRGHACFLYCKEANIVFRHHLVQFEPFFLSDSVDIVRSPGAPSICMKLAVRERTPPRDWLR